MATTYARMRQLIGTTAVWTANNLVLEVGEIGVEIASAGDVRVKIGDGNTAFSSLPYIQSSYITSLIQSSLNSMMPLTGGTMTGLLTLSGDPSTALQAATKRYVDSANAAQDTEIANKLSTGGGTMTGTLTLAGAPTSNLQAATKKYVDDADALKLNLAGGTMTGPIVLSGQPSAALDATPKNYVDTQVGMRLPITGGTMTGPIVLSAAPTTNLQAATKQYVDSGPYQTAVGGSSTYAGKVVKLNPNGFIDLSMLSLLGQYKGNLDVTTAYPTFTTLNNGDYWTLAATGNVDASWNVHMYDPPTSVTENQIAVYDGSLFHVAGAMTGSGSGAISAKVDKAGDTMTGQLTLSGDPTADMHAATKKYVDDAASVLAPVVHTHVMADITDFPARLGPEAAIITDWNLAIESGWYQGQPGLNRPQIGTQDWFVGYVEALNGSAVTQTVHAWAVDDSSNTYTYRRSYTNGTWSAWYKLQLSQDEQDARYAPLSHTHTTAEVTGLDTALAGKAPTSHTHTASEITDFASAVDARLPVRLGPAATLVTDWNLAIENGWYQGQPGLNNPPITDWCVGYVEAVNNSAITQTVHAWAVDDPSNTYTYRRSCTSGVWGAWYKLQLSQFEQDARYAQMLVANTFVSGQKIGDGTGNAELNLNGIVGNAKLINIQSSGVNRWAINTGNNVESGSNAGSTFEINRYADNGSWLETAFSIRRLDGLITCPSIYTLDTTTAANVTVTSTGQLRRSTSSIKYKKDVEDLSISLSDNAVQNLRPVWYRSKNPSGDDKPEWSHIGLIAEEVAEVEPRLVTFRTTRTTYDEDGNATTTTLATPEPEGVDYARLSVVLLDVVKRQSTKIKQLEERLSAIEAKLA